MATKEKGLSVDKALTKNKTKKRKTWSQTSKVDEVTEEIKVEKLDNEGYLVVISKYGDDAKGDWFNKESKIYSEINPLDTDESDNPMDLLFESISRKIN